MEPVTIAGLCFGRGLPKICVPLTGSGTADLLEEIEEARGLPADLLEWRADCFFDGFAQGAAALRSGRLSKPVLCTVRTRTEGGKAELTPADYEKEICELLALDGFQLFDIELAQGEDLVKELIGRCRERGAGVVVSKHDFEKTPPEDQMVETLARMKELGADLPKLAVMPQSPQDVLRLLSATLRASEKLGPVITMAMGDLGRLSRVSGGAFGSCLTFGAGRSASAPGQIAAKDLRAMLENLYPERGRTE